MTNNIFDLIIEYDETEIGNNFQHEINIENISKINGTFSLKIDEFSITYNYCPIFVLFELKQLCVEILNEKKYEYILTIDSEPSFFISRFNDKFIGRKYRSNDIVHDNDFNVVCIFHLQDTQDLVDQINGYAYSFLSKNRLLYDFLAIK